MFCIFGKTSINILETLDFNLSTCIEDILELLAPQAHNKGLEISGLIYPNVPTYLQGDASRLRQILMNLIGNAVKFTSHGEILVQIELRAETSTTATIYFAIIDTGIGISNEDQYKLFTRFTQVDASTIKWVVTIGRNCRSNSCLSWSLIKS